MIWLAGFGNSQRAEVAAVLTGRKILLDREVLLMTAWRVNVAVLERACIGVRNILIP